MKKITVREAAKILDMSEKVLARLIIMDKIPEIGFATMNKTKHSYYIFEEDVLRYKEERNKSLQKDKLKELNHKKITIEKAAEILDMDPKILARLLILGKIPEVGFAIPTKKYHSYTIFESDVLKYKEDCEKYKIEKIHDKYFRKKISLIEASELLGVPKALLAKKLKTGELSEVGEAILGWNNHYTYNIFEDDVLRYFYKQIKKSSD